MTHHFFNYHNSVYRWLTNRSLNNDNLKTFVSSDGAILSCTEIPGPSDIGVIIAPGLTVPRESYYRLCLPMQRENILLFDHRGQGDSSGFIEYNLCINDTIEIITDFKTKYGINNLIGIGHSFGALLLASIYSHSESLFDKLIALAPPNSIRQIATKLPLIFFPISSYMYCIYRALKVPCYRDNIVKHHMSFNFFKYAKSPKIIALNIKKPQYYNKLLNDMPDLERLIPSMNKKAWIAYGGNDHRLHKDQSAHLPDILIENKVSCTWIPELSHRFNSYIEKYFVVSYDNDLVLDYIKKIIYNPD